MATTTQLLAELRDESDRLRLEIAALGDVMRAAEHALAALEHPRKLDKQAAIDHLYGSIEAVKQLRATHGNAHADNGPADVGRGAAEGSCETWYS